jgi:hypothetical protein
MPNNPFIRHKGLLHWDADIRDSCLKASAAVHELFELVKRKNYEDASLKDVVDSVGQWTLKIMVESKSNEQA